MLIGTFCQQLIKLPEDVLVRQTESGNELYFISKGICKATCIDLRGETHQIGLIYENGVFGEISHILKCKRTASVYCVNYVTLLAIPRVEGASFKALTPYLK